ncbi:MAG TPA: hypothetical protein VKU77_19815 [Streptosporangiaceae bacterium]|nr:hypothetical protein [Streptosporangiaceae bacterium]
MLVIAIETSSGEPARWAGRRHDDDRPDATSGASAAELFDAVFHALHDGEQVALGLDCPLTVPAPADHDPAAAADGPAGGPGEGAGLADLGYLLGELGNWRPWTTVSTSLARWKANTSILVWQAVPAPGEGAVPASAAADSFFRQLLPAGHAEEKRAGPLVNLAAAAARRAGLFVDPSELAEPAVSITVTSLRPDPVR